MNKFITKPIIGLTLSFVLFTQQANSQSSISGHIFADYNNNSVFDAGEGLAQVSIWLLDNTAVSPFYQVYPVQSAITASDGSYSFTNLGAGIYQVKVLKHTLNPGIILNPANIITHAVSDNNAYDRDGEADGMTTVNISLGNYDNLDFGFLNNSATPGLNPNSRFTFDDADNLFIDVMSKTFHLATEDCNGNTLNPTLTITTDRQNNASSITYPIAGCNSCFPDMYWPGLNKGGFHGDDVTFQIFSSEDPAAAVGNDKVTTTLTFSSLMSDVHFTIYDIDAINPQLINGSIDHVRVTGYNGLNPIMPVIIAPQNQPYLSISGNNISGWPDYPDNNSTNNYPDSYNSDDADNGNAEIYFTSMVDKVVIEYEEYAPLLLNSSKKIAVPVSPIDNESQWALPAASAMRGISFGSIGYTPVCSVLAADVLSFDATTSGQKANLQWKKDNEQQLKQYNVQRLTANGSWTGLGNVKAAGAGHVYHFTDLHPAKGTNQYRLALLGLDGSYHLSETKKVTIAAINDIAIVGNPSSSLNLIVYGDAKDISVYDPAGQLLFDYPVKQHTASGTPITLNQFALHTGFYYVKALFANGEVKTLKFVKQ